MATLFVEQNTDFRGGAAETNITDIVFSNLVANAQRAIFEPPQFGPGLISNTVEITGDASSADQRFRFMDAAGTFSAAGLELRRLGRADSCCIAGTAGDRTSPDRARTTTSSATGGADESTAETATTDSMFSTSERPLQAWPYRVASGFDEIDLTSASGVAVYDLTPAAIDGIEQLAFSTPTIPRS